MTTEFVTPQVSTEHPKDNDVAYQQEMIAKAEAGLNTGSQSPEEKLYAGKYKTEEDLHKGTMELLKQKHGGNLEAVYKELERGFHSQDKGEAAADTQAATGDDSADDQKETQKEEALTTGVLNFDKYTSEFSTNGTLTDDSIAEITQAGIPQGILDQYLEGLKAVTEITTQQAYAYAGGEDNYKAMVDWARTRLSSKEVQAYNGAISTNDSDKRKAAITKMYERYAEANPQFVEGSGGLNSPGDVYQSLEQLKQDQKSQQYAKDPAFRDKVMKKLARSKIF